jgi:hypothetical protein
MAKRNSRQQSPSIGQRFTSLERLVRIGFRQTDARFRGLDVTSRSLDARLRSLSSNLSAFRKHTDTKFSAVHFELRSLRKEMNERFAAVDERFDQSASHVDGFMKLHETMDIEMRVMKEQMNRFEQRLERLEAAQAS